MDFYSSSDRSLSRPFTFSVLLRGAFSLSLSFFLKIISKPHTFRHFHRHRTFAMVIRGIAVKNYLDPMGEGAGFGRQEKGWHTQRGRKDRGEGRGERGSGHRSRVCLPIFPPGAMWIFVITEPKLPRARSRGRRSFYSRSERRFLISSNEAPHQPRRC